MVMITIMKKNYPTVSVPPSAPSSDSATSLSFFSSFSLCSHHIDPSIRLPSSLSFYAVSFFFLHKFTSDNRLRPFTSIVFSTYAVRILTQVSNLCVVGGINLFVNIQQASGLGSEIPNGVHECVHFTALGRTMASLLVPGERDVK